MLKRMLAFSLSFSLLAGFAGLVAPVASADVPDIYVSPSGSNTMGDGSEGAPYATILKASQEAEPGTTVHVKAGTYAGAFITDTDGEPGNPIRYVSEGAKLVPIAADSDGITDPEGIWENRGWYVEIDGFEVDGTGKTAPPNGIMNQGSYVEVKNNYIHNIANVSTMGCSGKGGAGINILDYYQDNPSSPVRMTGTKVFNNIVRDVGVGTCNKYHGIYISTSASVYNNVAYDISGAGIHLYHDAYDVDIVNNTVAASTFGVVVSSNAGSHYHWPSQVVDYVNVINNIFYDTSYGIYEYDQVGTHNEYYNNLVNTSSIAPITLLNGNTHSGTVTTAPGFVNYAARDFHLASGSNAINAGTSTLAPATDLEGNSRPSTAVDIGAYEFTTPGSGTTTLTFYHKDSIPTGSTATYWYKQALINGTVVWEQDVATDGTGWQAQSVPITTPSANFTLQFRLISKKSVSNYPVTINVDDVAVGGLTVQNAGFESGASNWTAAQTLAAFGSATSTSSPHAGSASYQFTFPGSTVSAIDANASITQTVPAASLTRTLTFYEKDNIPSPTTAGYWFKQALVNGVVVWEQDVGTDGTGWQSRTVSFTSTTPSFVLQFRLISKIGVSNYPVAFNVDQVAIGGLTLTNGGFDSLTGWTYAEDLAAFDGVVDTAVKNSGTGSLKLSFPGSTGSSNNDDASVSQTVSNS
ncbi:choice-of-anchor Q domain-containing protein [Cohnella sp. GCM10012308]|uniref:choice-of-anchor Q domain-containing protein n=1 Tax=Cohnella sp. GCM10012308 TaxID=3317329 RepID=UPI00360735C7